MRWFLPTLVAALVVPSAVTAELRRTTASATLRARPGEAQPAVITVSADTEVTVVETQGRWIKVSVRAGGKTVVGWLTRTQLSAPAAAAPPTTSAPPSAAWKEPAGGAATPATPVQRQRTGVPARAARATPAVSLRAEAGVGYRSLAMRFRSDGGGGLAGYQISADAALAGVDVAVAARPRRWLVLAAGGARTAYSSPGLEYMGPTLPPGEIRFSTVETDVRLGAAVRRGAFAMGARGGLRYEAFLPSEVANAARLPRERLLAVTAGTAIEVAPADARVGATFTFDVMVAGGRRQTPGLEDGADSEAGGLWASATIRVRLASRWWGLGSMALTHATTSWSGRSVRQPDSTSADRTDQGQLVQLGLGAEL